MSCSASLDGSASAHAGPAVAVGVTPARIGAAAVSLGLTALLMVWFASRVRLEVQLEPALPATWIVRHELVDDNPSLRQFGDALSNPEVNRTHGVGIGQRGRFERARMQDDVDTTATSVDNRIEPLTFHCARENTERIIRAGRLMRLTLHRATPDVDRRIASTDHLAEKQTEAFVRPSHTPATLSRRVDAILETGSTRPACGSLLFDDQPCVDQLRQVLSDRVVIEREVRGQLCDVGGRALVGHVPENLVSRRVTESLGLLLQRCRHQWSPSFTSLADEIEVRSSSNTCSGA
jgi:hypothetical protein